MDGQMRAIAAVLTLGLATTAAAAEPLVLSDDGRIDAALRAGEIDDLEALWLRYLMTFEPASLPARYRGSERPGWSCGTVTVQQIKDRWDEFDPRRQRRMRAVLAPFHGDLTAGGARVEPPPPPDPMRDPDDTCFGQYGAFRVSGEHFAVEWDDPGISQADTEDFLDALEFAWDQEVETWGWRPPNNSDRYWTLAYVSDQDMGGAYTSAEYCAGEVTPYIVTGANVLGWGTWFQDMAGHEFNHAMQMCYSFAPEFWWWEATATWVEEYVYESHDEWGDYVAGYAQQPWMAMNASSQSDQEQFWHMYGMCIMNHFLDQYVGGHELVRGTWEAAQGDHGQYDLSLQEMLDAQGVDFDEHYPMFMAAATVMDFEDQDAYPSLTIQARVTDLPAAGSSSSATEPETYGQNFIRIDGVAADPSLPDLCVSVDGEEGGDWVAVLVGTEDRRVVDVVELAFDGDHGEGCLQDLASFDEGWLVVSPRADGWGGREYAWEARADDVPDPAGDDDDLTPTEDMPPPYAEDDDPQLLGECTCSTRGGAGGGLVALVLAVLLAATRGRRLTPPRP